MACTGSTAASAFGSPGAPFVCPPGQVLVGLDINHAPPVQGPPRAAYRRGRLEHDDAMYDAGFDAPDAAPVTCQHDSDCTTPMVCLNGVCAEPPIWRPGAVLGVVAYYCAAADDVYAKTSNPPTRTRTGYTPSGGATSTFLCPAGQALTGATAWVNPAGDVEQIRLQATVFAAGTPAGQSSPLYPSSRMPGSQATPTTISTLGAPPAALFANGVAQGWGSGIAIDALGFGCQDYQDEFDSSSARRLACCTGTAPNPQFCQGYTAAGGACDAFMTGFCQTDCGPDGSCLHPQCGCLGSPVAQPECYDSRCADTAGAYMTAAMTAMKPSCPTTTSCNIWQALNDGQYLAKEITPPTGCAPPPPPNILSKPIVIIAIMLFIFLIFLAGLLGGSSDGKKALMFAPPPPPGIFV